MTQQDLLGYLVPLAIALVAWRLVKRRMINTPSPDPDVRSMRRLQHRGALRGDEVLVEFSLYFATEQNAQKAAEAVTRLGYTTRTVPSGEGGWLCLATRRQVVNTASIRNARMELEGAAYSARGVYEEWKVVD